jgi:hypothetical protein
MHPLPLPLRWLAWMPPVFGFAVIPREPERRPEPPLAVEPWAAEEMLC